MKINKKTLYLLSFLIIALVLRIITAHNTDVGTDEMIYSIIPLNIISAERLGTLEQSPLFFYLNDIGYQLFGGITPISIRLWSIIFGSLTLLVVFLISKELFENEKAAMASAFLFAVSGYSIRYNFEMDMVAFFFLALSMFFFIRYMKGEPKFLYLSVLFFALGLLTKTLIVAFLPGYFIVWLLYLKNKNKTTEFKRLGLALLLGLILISPILIYNYFTVTKLGISDYYFSNILGIGETVHQGLQGKPWAAFRLWENTKILFGKFFTFDGLILITGLIGLVSLISKKKLINKIIVESTILLVGSTLIFFIYLAGQNGSSTHFLYIPLVLSIYAGDLIYNLKPRIKYLVPGVVIAALALTIFSVNDAIDSGKKSITLELRNYVHENIPENAIVVIDPRIYRGIHAWVFNDKHYLDGGYFPPIAEAISTYQGQKKTAPLYYIECMEGSNCGWKPEDFARIYDQGQTISNYFKQRTKKVAEIRTTHNFDIHLGTIPITPGIYEAIDKTHSFWFYPVGWKYPETATDYYQVSGSDKIINGFGWVMLWIDIVLALLSIPFIFWQVFKKRNVAIE